MGDRYAPAADVVVEDFEDDVSLFRPAENEVLVLNQSAGDVWRLADGELDVDGILATLAAAYGVTAESLRADVLSVIEDLSSRGFLVNADLADAGSPA